jgi:hypothetical protein
MCTQIEIMGKIGQKWGKNSVFWGENLNILGLAKSKRGGVSVETQSQHRG